MFIFITKFFDKLEDRVRARLSHRSIIYAFIGGSAHVIFWRGIWHTSDFIMAGNWHLSEARGFWGWVFYEPVSLVWSTAILLLTGLFVASFIGERIIISGLKKEKKVTDRTEEEVQKEENKINIVNVKLDSLMNEIKEIKNELVQK
jgi:MFS superfamily sulfate permease-like transporter